MTDEPLHDDTFSPGNPAKLYIGQPQSFEGEQSERHRRASQLPFIVRAWFLRNHEESKDIPWRDEPYTTGPLWSLHSDPLCDLAGLDYSYDIEDD